jgi:hypothetical protein
LRIAAPAPLPGLRTADDAGPPDVVLRLQAMPDAADVRETGALVYRSADTDESGAPTLVVARLRDGELVRFRYSDGVQFVLGAAGRDVWVTWREPSTLEDVATYLLGPVFGFLLRLRGVTCVHASAVAIEDQAVIFAGPAGAGKSTVAATFALRGHAVMADDVVALTDENGLVAVQPGPSRLRLWPESVRALYGTEDALPRLTPTWDKRFLDAATDGYRFQPAPLPLAAVYVLAARASHRTAPRSSALSPAAALIALAANTHANHLADSRLRAAEFRGLARVASDVAVYRTWPPDDITGLRSLCDEVVRRVAGAVAHV